MARRHRAGARMIPLRVQASSTADRPFVLRLNAEARSYELDQLGLKTPFDGELLSVAADRVVYGSAEGEAEFAGVDPSDIDGDVVLVDPHRGVAHRLVRAASPHNTFLVTERCDQLCVMCSQPPKSGHVDMFPYFEAAALLAPRNMIIGISGGEPTLYKDQLLTMLTRVLEAREDLKFHVLTNGQHFEAVDLAQLKLLPPERVTWGVPIYADEAALHDSIVGKPGAFERLSVGLATLARAGCSIELRTVVTRENVNGLASLAGYIAANAPFAAVWAIMQLENIGFGRMNWERLFYDHSIRFEPIGAAIDIARARGVETLLYNFPRCTVPAAFRHLAPATISDWKRRYPAGCDSCSEQSLCTGLFEWRPDQSFERLVPL
jgi:His-Xaa-Ser system radical SAM maturase HxsC